MLACAMEKIQRFLLICRNNANSSSKYVEYECEISTGARLSIHVSDVEANIYEKKKNTRSNVHN